MIMNRGKTNGKINNEKDELNYLKDEFDYNFNKNSSNEDFLIEFRKFLGLYNYLFYDKKRFLTAFNSLEIRLKKDDIKHIFSLYEYTKKKDLEQEKGVLIDFLYTYWKTITNGEYCLNYDKAKESIEDFKKVLEESGHKRTFFSYFQQECFDFYKNLLEFAIQKDIFIENNLIERIFNNLNGEKDYCNYIVNLLVKNNKSLYKVIEFDDEIDKNIEQYYLYVIQSLDEFGQFNYAKEVFSKLAKGKYLNDEKIKSILNKYIDIENNLCKNLKSKQYGFSTALYEINYIKNEFIYILENVSSLDKVKKDKIHECLKNLLGLKRFLVSDNNYVQTSMNEYPFSTVIKDEQIKEFKKNMQKDRCYLSIYSNVDFISMMEKALELYSKYPLPSIILGFNINEVRGIYSVGIEVKKISKNNFKLFFDNVGQEYTIKHPELVNKLSINYYEELLKHLSNVFNIQQSLLNIYLEVSELKNDVFSDLKKELKYDFDNDYAVLVSNILAIEANILQLIENKGLNPKKDGFDNINELFKYYKKNKNATNWLMYINYILYEKSGMNLRDDAMHGNIINTDLSIPLIVSFTGLIFTSRLLNEGK